MSGGMPLGAVEVEVRANLDKLVQGFAAGRAQTQQFNQDMSRVTAQTKLTAAEQLNLANVYNQLIKTYDPLRNQVNRYKADLENVAKINASGMFTQTELSRLNQGIAAYATTNKTFRDLIPAAGGAGGAIKKEAEAVEKAAGSHRSLFREMEVGIRAVRLFGVVFGVEMVGQIGKFLVSTIESVGALKDQAAQLGLTTDQLQEYRGVAKDVGMSSDDMDAAFAHLRQTVAQIASGQVSSASKLFKALGVSIKDAGGQARSQDDIFNDLIDRIGRVGNESQRTEALAIAFGESVGPKMGELVKQGSAGVDSLRQSVRDLGIVMSEDQIQKADETAKKLKELHEVLSVKFASTVVENADAIVTLANAVSFLVGALMQWVTGSNAFQGLIAFLNLLRTGTVSGQAAIPKVATEVGQVGHSIDIALPPATKGGRQGKGSGNIDLSNLLAPKGPKPKKTKFDNFEADLAREKEQQLQLEHDATGNLVEQNRIDKEIIDLKLSQQIEQIKRQQHDGSLTKAEAAKLIAEAKNTALAQKEAADRAMRIAQIEAANQFADEMEKLTQDGLEIAKDLARTDAQRKAVDLAILDSKQRQALAEIDKEIAIAQEKKDEQRIAELTAERKKLMQNQLDEIKDFNLQHLSQIDQFKNNLPRTPGEFTDASHNMAFDLFNKKLAQAAQFAGDVGDAFGKAAAAIARGEKPIDVLTGLLSDLADTFTKNFIEQPISEAMTKALGIPLAKQGFGDQLDKLAQKAGGTALTTTQMNTALAIATTNLSALSAAAQAAAASLSATAAGGTAKGLSGFAGFAADLFKGAAGGFSGAGMDFSSGLDFSGLGAGLDFGTDFSTIALPGFASGGRGVLGGRSGTDRNVLSLNGQPFLRVSRGEELSVDSISSSRLARLGPAGIAKMLASMRGGDTHNHFGDIIVPGAKDDRSARASGRQALSVIQRGLSQNAKSGLNR